MLISVGDRFGLLVAHHYRGDGEWTCHCDCGSVVVRRAAKLRSGRSWHCSRSKHAARNYERPEYAIWCAAKQRCTNPKSQAWSHYGGRGITMCQRWLSSFDDFLADVGVRPSPDLTLERIDNDRGYEPGNVRWAAVSEQAANRRPPRPRRLIEFNGEQLSLTEWADKLGLTVTALQRRLDTYGWSIERALSVPKLDRGRPRKADR